LPPTGRVAPKTIRRVLDAAGARDVGDLPEELDGGHTVEDQEQVPEPEQSHAIDVPGLLAKHLKATKVAEIREALRGGRTIRREQDYSVRVTVPLAVHQATLKQCADLTGVGSTPAGRKAYRTYADRITAATRKK
jgi:hypothetical protein